MVYELHRCCLSFSLLWLFLLFVLRAARQGWNCPAQLNRHVTQGGPPGTTDLRRSRCPGSREARVSVGPAVDTHYSAPVRNWGISTKQRRGYHLVAQGQLYVHTVPDR